EQVKRLEEVGKTLGTAVTGHACEGMKGLIKEGQGLIEENETGEALDVALIGAAQRIEHYEIAGYGTAVALAKELGQAEVARTLQKTLDEEGDAAEKLTKIAEGWVNERAHARTPGAGPADFGRPGTRPAQGRTVTMGAALSRVSR